MSKAVLIGINPKWCELIASGKKTLDVRKTKPKLETPFKCYIYCTKPKEVLLQVMKDGDDVYGEAYHGKPVFIKTSEGSYYGTMLGKGQRIIGEFVCDSISEIKPFGIENMDDFEKQTCLNSAEIVKYLGGFHGYAWHISDLKIYDKPKKLSEFETIDEMAVKQCEYRLRTGQPESVTQNGGWINGSYICTKDEYEVEWCEKCKHKPITRPPQSWCYVEEREENG